MKTNTANITFSTTFLLVVVAERKKGISERREGAGRRYWKGAFGSTDSCVLKNIKRLS